MADIQLSAELFDDIQQAVQRQEPQADQILVTQYLAAVIGYLLASQRGIAAGDRDELMEELCGFAHHVYQDVLQRQQPVAQPPSGQAFGYWEPPKK